MTNKQRRPLELRIEVAEDKPNVYRLVAECADEVTYYLISDPDGKGVDIDLHQNVLPHPLLKLLAREHMAQCTACRAWAGVAA